MRRMMTMIIVLGALATGPAWAGPTRNGVATLTGSGKSVGDFNDALVRAVQVDLDLVLTRAAIDPEPILNPRYYQPSGTATITFEGLQPVDVTFSLYGGWERTDPAWGLIAGLGEDGNVYWLALYDGTSGHGDQMFVRRCTAAAFAMQLRQVGSCEMWIEPGIPYIEGDFVFAEVL